jgi:hypothetical protein
LTSAASASWETSGRIRRLSVLLRSGLRGLRACRRRESSRSQNPGTNVTYDDYFRQCSAKKSAFFLKTNVTARK